MNPEESVGQVLESEAARGLCIALARKVDLLVRLAALLALALGYRI